MDVSSRYCGSKASVSSSRLDLRSPKQDDMSDREATDLEV